MGACTPVPALFIQVLCPSLSEPVTYCFSFPGYRSHFSQPDGQPGSFVGWACPG